MDVGVGWVVSNGWIWLDSLLLGFIFPEDGIVKIQDVVEEDVKVMRWRCFGGLVGFPGLGLKMYFDEATGRWIVQGCVLLSV